MTDRLYYRDPYAREVEALILASEPGEEGGRSTLVLDRTVFYPTSGGQPHDLGTLAGYQVVDVIDRDSSIAHVIEGTIESGRTVHGAIDWARRFDHMQQHTGQHILSAALVRGHAAPTVSFHLGKTSSTIDVARDLPSASLMQAEDEANRIVCENRPVTIRFATADEAAALPLRKEPLRGGTLRLIEVEDFDLSACGGTHVARTGEIGAIAVRGSERFKGGTRIEFVCGRRALSAYRDMRDALTASVRALSVVPHELPDAIVKLQTEHRDALRQLKDLHVRVAAYEARQMMDEAAQLPGGARLIAVSIDTQDATYLKALASAAVAEPGYTVVLTSRTTPALVVVGRSPGLSVNPADVIRELTTKFQGRGGGRGDLAQAGGLQGNVSDILEEARSLIQRTVAGIASGTNEKAS